MRMEGSAGDDDGKAAELCRLTGGVDDDWDAVDLDVLVGEVGTYACTHAHKHTRARTHTHTTHTHTHNTHTHTHTHTHT